MMKAVHSRSQDRPCVLFVDDETPNRQAFFSSFRDDLIVLMAGSAKEALELLQRNTVHVIITDQRMPEIKGDQLLKEVKEKHPLVRRMLMTAYADLEAVIQAVNQGGIMHYFAKPWDPQVVLKAIEMAYKEYCADEADQRYKEQLEQANQQLEFVLRQKLLS